VGPGDRHPIEYRKGEQAPSIAGRWQVLYMTGTVAGKREAFVEPNLIVPITERNINLPIFGVASIGSGSASTDGRQGAGNFSLNKEAPIVYKGRLDYTLSRQGNLNVIHMTPENGPDVKKSWVQGIYRIVGDNLIICYELEKGTWPETFAAAKENEILLILRRERPDSQTKFTLPPGGIVLPATGPPTPRRN
jgi:hypothetical protein